MKEKAVMVWSGGKDSSFALHKVIQGQQYEVIALMSTINGENKRLSMHGVREEIIEKQASAIGLPLVKMYITDATYEHYESKLAEQMEAFKAQGVKTMIFGDIFLEDLRKYREEKLAKVGMKAHFPLWNYDTKEMIQDFLAEGFKTLVCCVALAKMKKEMVGKEISQDWLRSLPAAVDPCGENGEFHTCCFAGPIFTKNIELVAKEIRVKEYQHEKEVYSYAFVDIESA